MAQEQDQPAPQGDDGNDGDEDRPGLLEEVGSAVGGLWDDPNTPRRAEATAAGRRGRGKLRHRPLRSSPRRPRILMRAVLSAALVFGSLAAPSAGSAQNPQGPGAQQQDPCDRLDEVPGRAEGLEERCHGGSSSGVARGDFNGDGFADLAIGTPLKDTPTTVEDSGAVYVIYGSADGLVPAGSGAIPPTQFWSQNTPTVPGNSDAGDRFGAALAAGEFNGDDFSDLAIGIPRDDEGGVTDSGRVVVLRGSQNGLTARNVQSLSVAVFGLGKERFATAHLGSALTWGDFTGDGIGDLAIGAPGYDDGITDQGLVWLVEGLETGLVTFGGNPFLRQGDSGVADRAEEYDHFGEVLSAGDFDRDNRADLVVGVPDEDAELFVNGNLNQRFDSTGIVHVFFGDQAGVHPSQGARTQTFTSDVGTGLGSTAFGAALAAGDFDGEGVDDLAIGGPGFDFDNTSDMGAVFVLDSAPGSPLRGRFSFRQDHLNLIGNSEAGDGFGAALAAGNFNDDGFVDLAIGVPLEDVAGQDNAGEVNAVYGSTNGLNLGNNQLFRQGGGGVGGTNEAGDQFGRSLTAWNFGRNHPRINGGTARTADLAIGVPREDLFAPDERTRLDNAGSVMVLYGTVGVLTATGNQLFFQSNIGGFTNVAGDFFGAALY